MRYDDELEVIEMTLVQLPFLLDFAGAWLDRRPDFEDDVWVERLSQRHPEGRVTDALYVIHFMDHHGVYLTDLHSGNLCFPEYDPPADGSVHLS